MVTTTRYFQGWPQTSEHSQSPHTRIWLDNEADNKIGMLAYLKLRVDKFQMSTRTRTEPFLVGLRRSSASAKRHVRRMAACRSQTPLFPLRLSKFVCSVALIVAAASASDARQTMAASRTCGHWRVTSTGPAASDLSGVSANSPGNVWTVGLEVVSSLHTIPLVERFVRGHWRTVHVGLPVAGDWSLSDVRALANGTVWAVGGGVHGGLVDRWDGHRWLATVFSRGSGAQLQWLSAVGSDDVWAAGNFYDSRPAFVEHWDGRQWHRSQPPSRTGEFFDSITALSADDVWASGNDEYDRSFIEHWNGHSWQSTSLPRQVINQDDIVSIREVGPSTLWAVTQNGLILQWHRGKWSILFNLSRRGLTLAAMGSRGDHDVWLAGSIHPPGKALPARALVAHWNWSAWSW
jgi:hypothetical protein